MRVFLFLSILTNLSAFGSNTEIFRKYVTSTDCKQNCAKGIPYNALERFFEKAVDIAPEKLESTTWAYIVDMKQHSKNKRGYLLNLKTGSVSAYHTAHGSGSDRDHDGIADKFSDIDGSHMSSLGMYITAETYHGKHGYSLKLDGQEGTNANARSRFIVKHGADYMSSNFLSKHGKSGRSQGCPAVNHDVVRMLIDKLKGGSLYYIHN